MTISAAVVSRRTFGLALVLAVLAGCGQDVPGAPPSATKDPGEDLRRRLADAVRSQHPRTADLVESALTDLAVVDAAWLPGWRVVDVNHRGTPHGRRFFVGLADDDRVTFLAGRADAFGAMTTAAGVDVAEPGTATALAQLFLDATRTFAHYAYRVEDVRDVRWLPQPTPQQQAERRRLEQRYRTRVVGPVARRTAAGWALTLWTVDDRSLVEHTLGVSPAGQVIDDARTVERRLPVPETL